MHAEMTIQDEHAEVASGAAGGTHTIDLEALTIADCASLYESIRSKLSAGLSLMLNISDCQDVDTAGLQLLAAIQNDPTVNLRVHWTKPSEVVAMKAQRLGLMSWINAGFVEN